MKRIIRQWLSLALAATLCAGLLAGCGQKEEPMTLSVCAGGDVVTFDPAFSVAASDATVLTSLYENLMRLSCDVSGNTTVTEGMARSVDAKENFDGTVTYTFHLRNARWSDGRSVKAEDFVYAWQRLVNPLTYSPNAYLLSMVQGYDAVRAGGDMSELAVTAVNDSTLEVVLVGKYDWFLTDVCTAAATIPLRQDVVRRLKEDADAAAEAAGEGASALKWWHDPTKLVTNGPFCVEQYQPGESMTLTAADRYYGSTGPDVLNFTFASGAEAAWELYDAGAVDFVYALPDAQIETLQAEGRWEPTPELSAYTILFNGEQLPFDEPAVRKAFSLALDRAALAELAGVTAKPAGGLVPYGVPGDGERDFRTAGGDLLGCDPEQYEENSREAKSMLAQSSFDSLYDLEYLYVAEGPASQIAQAVTGQWRDVLGVQVRARAVTPTELTAALKTGEYFMAGVSSTALANDAEAFLTPFCGRSELNAARYANSAYDTLLSIIDSASDAAARLACLHDAEVLLLDDAAASPLYFTGTAWKLRESYTGLCRDPRGSFGFAGVTQTAA